MLNNFVSKTNSEAKIKIVRLVVWNGYAFLPTKGQLESGPFVDIQPVYKVEIGYAEIENAIQKLLATGHERFPDPQSKKEFKEMFGDTLPKATGARSWKKLSSFGIPYTISWNSDHDIRIYMPGDKPSKYWDSNLENTIVLSPNTSLGQISKIIVDDILSKVFNTKLNH